MINALALEEQQQGMDNDVPSDRDDAAEPERSQTSPAGERPLIQRSSTLPSPLSYQYDSPSSDDEDGDAVPYEAINATAALAPGATDSLGALPPRLRGRTPSTTPTLRRLADHDEDTTDLSSSLHALHRPIAARRRAMTGEGGEIARGGIYAQSVVDLAAAVETPSIAESESGTQTTTMETRNDGGRKMVRAATGSSMIRKSKLAEKLEDIFGLEGAEEVLAGE